MSAVIFFGLLALSVVLAVLSRRGAISNNMNDVMVASRSFGAILVFFIAVGETYGIGTMIGVPGAVYSKGVSYALWFLGYILLGFSVGYFVNPVIWRMGRVSGAVTMAECFGWRFGSKFLEVIVAIIVICFILPWMQMQFGGLGVILRHMGWDISYSVGVAISAMIAYFYIAVAGIRAPAWVSIMKDILMITAIVAGGTVAAMKFPGGVEGIFDAAIAQFPDRVIVPVEKDPAAASFALSTIIFQAMGFVTAPFLFQFIFTAKSEDTVRRNQIIMPLYMYMYPFLIIAAYYVLVTVPDLKTPDESFMALAAGNLPSWMVGIVGAGGALTCILVLSVSALCLGGTFTRNIWGYFRPQPSQKEAVRVTNIATASSLLFTGIMAVLFPGLMLGIINLAFLFPTQCFPMLLATAFWPRATKQGAIAGLVAGMVVVLILVSTNTTFWGLNKGIIAMVANSLALIIVSLLTKPDAVTLENARILEEFEEEPA